MSPPDRQSNLPHCRLNNGCPVAPLNSVTVDAHLGPVSVGKVDDANFLQALVCFNNVKLPDEEAVQQDNSATSAMRVKRSFDCLLSNEDTSPFRVKLRMAGPVSVVNWMLRTGEIHQVVLAQTEKMRVECALAGTCGCSSQGHRHELLSPTHHGRAGSR